MPRRLCRPVANRIRRWPLSLDDVSPRAEPRLDEKYASHRETRKLLLLLLLLRARKGSRLTLTYPGPGKSSEHTKDMHNWAFISTNSIGHAQVIQDETNCSFATKS